MTNWMTETYEKTSAAHCYYFGFIFAGLVYVVTGMTFAELSVYFKMDRASTAKGGFAKVRIRARSAELKELLPRAILLGDESILMSETYNRGDMFEKVVVERFTTERWEKNSTPYYLDGDATINGEKVQIKLNQAELTNEKILRKYFPALT